MFVNILDQDADKKLVAEGPMIISLLMDALRIGTTATIGNRAAALLMETLPIFLKFCHFQLIACFVPKIRLFSSFN